MTDSAEDLANDANVKTLVYEAFYYHAGRGENNPHEHSISGAVVINNIIRWKSEQNEKSLICQRQSVDNCGRLVVKLANLASNWLKRDPSDLIYQGGETIYEQNDPPESSRCELSIVRRCRPALRFGLYFLVIVFEILPDFI